MFANWLSRLGFPAFAGCCDSYCMHIQLAFRKRTFRKAMSGQHHLQVLQRHYKRHRGFPATAKLAEVVEMSSSARVFGLVGRLSEAGYLQRLGPYRPWQAALRATAHRTGPRGGAESNVSGAARVHQPGRLPHRRARPQHHSSGARRLDARREEQLHT